MTTMQIDRAVVEQALDALESYATHRPLPGRCPVRDVEYALRTVLAEPETCTWQQDGDSDSGLYATSCRHYFNLEDGTPEDNKLAWCCYCGKKLAQELITEDGDE
jgi:hypothetical protein